MNTDRCKKLLKGHMTLSGLDGDELDEIDS